MFFPERVRMVCLSTLIFFIFLFNNVSYADQPPVYCIKKNTAVLQSNCDAYLFGSIHSSSQDATTPRLIEIAKKSKYVYFESLIPVQGKPPFNMLQYTQSPEDFRKLVENHAKNNFLVIPKETLLEVLNSQIDTHTDLHLLMRQSASIFNSWCNFSYVRGTEMNVFIALIGQNTTLNLIEPDAPVFVTPAPRRIDALAPLDKSKLSINSSNEQIKEFICTPLAEAQIRWRNQKKCLTQFDYCLYKIDSNSIEQNKLRNEVMFQNLLNTMKKDERPLVIVGLAHLYSDYGLISKLNQSGHHVSPLD